jgi:ribosomal protein L11 methyltransferase
MKGSPLSLAGGRPQSQIDASTVVARLRADAPVAQRIADFLTELLDPNQTAVGTFEGPRDNWTVEICFRAIPDRALVRKLVARAAGKAAARTMTFETLAARDWVRSSLAGLRTVEAGRFVVHGSHDRHRVAHNRLRIEIEAALAFGTGHHGTTRGCLFALDRILKARRPRRMLDLGTGTGVLAIAAAKALHARVLASDIDPIAVRTARANARSNAAGHRVEIIRAAGVTARRFAVVAPFDLVSANILLKPLQRLARPLSRLLAPHARAILSGVLPSQANAVLAAYAAHGLRLERRITLDGWVTLVLIRPS